MANCNLDAVACKEYEKRQYKIPLTHYCQTAPFVPL